LQVKIDVTFSRAVTGFAASFVNRGVPRVGFAMRRQRVMSSFGGVAFGAGFAAYVLAGVYLLTLLRLRGVIALAGFFIGRLVLGKSRGQGRDPSRDHWRQRRQAKKRYHTYLQSSHMLLLCVIYSELRNFQRKCGISPSWLRINPHRVPAKKERESFNLSQEVGNSL
jgi:hypothetical protein